MNKVEVRSDCGGWKDKGKLISLNIREKTITVRFEGKFTIHEKKICFSILFSGPSKTVPLSCAKFENPQLSSQICLEEGDEIEVFWRASVDKEFLWYPG